MLITFYPYPIAPSAFNPQGEEGKGKDKALSNSFSSMVEQHSSKVHILVRFRKRIIRLPSKPKPKPKPKPSSRKLAVTLAR